VEEMELKAYPASARSRPRAPVPIVVIAGLIALSRRLAGIVYFASRGPAAAGHGRPLLLGADLANPYVHSTWTTRSPTPTRPSPADPQPHRLLPCRPFMAIWAAILMGEMVYLTGTAVDFSRSGLSSLDGDLGRHIECRRGRRGAGLPLAATWSFVLLTKSRPESAASGRRPRGVGARWPSPWPRPSSWWSLGRDSARRLATL